MIPFHLYHIGDNMFLSFNLSAKGFWDFLVGIQLLLKPKRLVI